MPTLEAPRAISAPPAPVAARSITSPTSLESFGPKLILDRSFSNTLSRDTFRPRQSLKNIFETTQPLGRVESPNPDKVAAPIKRGGARFTPIFDSTPRRLDQMSLHQLTTLEPPSAPIKRVAFKVKEFQTEFQAAPAKPKPEVAFSQPIRFKPIRQLADRNDKLYAPKVDIRTADIVSTLPAPKPLTLPLPEILPLVKPETRTTLAPALMLETLLQEVRAQAVSKVRTLPIPRAQVQTLLREIQSRIRPEEEKQEQETILARRRVERVAMDRRAILFRMIYQLDPMAFAARDEVLGQAAAQAEAQAQKEGRLQVYGSEVAVRLPDQTEPVTSQILKAATRNRTFFGPDGSYASLRSTVSKLGSIALGKVKEVVRRENPKHIPVMEAAQVLTREANDHEVSKVKSGKVGLQAVLT